MPKEFAEDVAETVFDMMNRGNHDPTVEEIIEEHSGPVTAATNVRFWKDQLPAVRDVLAHQPKTATVHLVAPAYYEVDAVEDMPTARKCVATSCKAVGLRIGSAHDLMWQAVQEHNMKAGIGKADKALSRAYQSYLLEQMTDEQLNAVVELFLPAVETARQADRLLEKRDVSRTPLFPKNETATHD